MKKTLKLRVIKNWVTSVIGLAIIVLTSLSVFKVITPLDWKMYVTMYLLGWMFFMGKNTLLNAISLGLFKFKDLEIEDVKYENNKVEKFDH